MSTKKCIGHDILRKSSANTKQGYITCVHVLSACVRAQYQIKNKLKGYAFNCTHVKRLHQNLVIASQLQMVLGD